MPGRGRRIGAALLALLAGAALTAQTPAPQALRGIPGPQPRRTGNAGHRMPHGAYGGYGGSVIVSPIVVLPAGVPAPARTPHAKPTKRPPGGPDVFETHSSTDANE
jgi:hypothetical protein